jgi:hypothetical protein
MNMDNFEFVYMGYGPFRKSDILIGIVWIGTSSHCAYLVESSFILATILRPEKK